MKDGVSVIIPTYNREQFLKEAIDSVLEQDLEGTVELIVSDDGSTDGTLELARSYGDRVKVLPKPKYCTSQGASGARNRGINAATQPFICFLDSDDFYLPKNLRTLLKRFGTDKAIGYVFCRLLELKEIDNQQFARPWTHHWIFQNDIKNPVISRYYVVHTNSFMFRREVFNQVGLFNESYTNGEDGDLWMRISEKFTGKFSNHYGAVYRSTHGIQQLTSNSRDQIDSCLRQIHKQALHRYYDLNMRDKNRLFELKHLMLYHKYKNERLLYFSNYIKLICSFPLPFMQMAAVRAVEYAEKPFKKKWTRIENYKLA